jgi:quinol monooxygenase YgiN
LSLAGTEKHLAAQPAEKENTMSEQMVLISKHRIKEGKLEELRQLNKEVMPMIEASKPGTVFQGAYVSENGSEVRFVHVFPDADAFERHLIGADERIARAYEFIEPVSMEIFGSPGEKVIQMFKEMESRGISLHLWPKYLGGLIRLAAG